MASSSVLLGASATAALTGTPAGKALPRPCFLAARPRTVSGGRLCLQNPPRATPAYNDAADATDKAIDGVKGVADELKKGVAEAAEAVSGNTDKAVEEAGKGATEVDDKAKDLAEQAKKATEEAWDGAKDAAQGITDKVAAAAKKEAS
ncbi:cold acclimation protein [Hordeum vulgare]|uniref:Uncharacterized protein n=1 Tax=Hordeum vulgare subsp. vulgare TaxID=112509 RepID=A0A8I6WHL4_HORVV|nr:protein EaeB-like [Hordeum vulgare subsp. vulgare]KAE8819808.1 cold acclimation protein [Hordeum vulgare]